MHTHKSTTYNSQKCPISDDRVDKENIIIENVIVFSYKKEQNIALGNNLDETGGGHDKKISHKEKDKYKMISFIWEIEKK